MMHTFMANAEKFKHELELNNKWEDTIHNPIYFQNANQIENHNEMKLSKIPSKLRCVF